MRKFHTALASALLATALHNACAQDVLRVYGPGGPAPAMKEAASAFEKQTGIQVQLTAGPTGAWIAQAQQDADLVYSGSETMMTDLVAAMGDQLGSSAATPLYLRPLAMLVRPGNPRHIRAFTDLMKPGVKVLVVNGSGQNGVWEDAAGRTGDIRQVTALRENIVSYASNSALARTTWIQRPDIDVWLIWDIWQVSNASLADIVPIEPKYAIYRDTGVAITARGERNGEANQFVEFLRSGNGAAIFSHFGWKTQ